ncbi:MAG: hypothetical protein KBT46_09025, partial [Ruminococcus sp.]|nr:hypothetical protein [Candidatus Copronaster equi]
VYGGDEISRNAFSEFVSQSIICSGTNKPCLNCKNCIKAENKIHPDIIVIDPEKNGEKTFKISFVREMITDSFIAPDEARYKVYILKSADKMNVQAQNALLKIIEEPPEYVRFILECDSVAPMLDTIISRVTIYNLGAEKNDSADEISIKANEYAEKLAFALTKPTELEFMKITSEFEKDKELLENVLNPLRLIFRDAVAIKVSNGIAVGKSINASRELASKISLGSLFKLLENIDSFKESISHNANKNLLITRFCSVLRNSAYNK